MTIFNSNSIVLPPPDVSSVHIRGGDRESNQALSGTPSNQVESQCGLAEPGSISRVSQVISL